MPDYLTPGVFVEELPAQQTIEGVSTSIAGFVGAARRGPTVGLPRLVTSFPDFVRRYGDHLDESWGAARYLAFAVQGFFQNGGQLAYVARVAGPGAAPAARTFSDGFARRLAEDTAADPAERASVRLVSLHGVSVGSRLRFVETFAGQPQTQIRRVVSYADPTGTVLLDSPLTFRYTAAKCVVGRVGLPAPAGEGSSPSLTVAASSEGTWGNTLRVTVSHAYGAASLARAGAVAASTTLAGIPLAFDAEGPEEGARSVALDDVAELSEGDTVEFREGANAEQRVITGIDGQTISWNRPLLRAYTGDQATVARTSAVLAPAELRPLPVEDGPGPDAGAESLEVTSLEGIQAGDTLEFWNPTPQLERRTIEAVDDTATPPTINWDGALDNAYTAEGSTVHLMPAVRARVAEAAGFDSGSLVRIRQGDRTQVARVAEADQGNDTLTFDEATYPLLSSYDAGAELQLALAGVADATSVDLASATNLYQGAVVEIDDGSRKSYHRVSAISGDTLVMAANLGRDVPVGSTIRVVELSLVVDDGDTTERFDNLSLDPNADNYAPQVVNPRSQLVRVTDEGSTAAVPFNLPQVNWAEAATDPTADPRALLDGDDGGQPGAGDLIGQDLGPGRRTGIAALSDIDSVAIVAVPGSTDVSVQGALLGQCEELKDRFAVLDLPPAADIGSGGPDDVLVRRSAFDSLYGAMYHPWLVTRDPDPASTEGLRVPPSGHVIGVYARVDNTRGVHKAPANEEVEGITDLAVKLSDREQAILNPIGVNVIRDFRDSRRGLRVWGARCITSNVAWRYVPVRRLFIFVEESLQEGLQFVVFEPNSEALWAKVIRTVSGFLRRVWLDGALAGLTEEEAFQVRCDATTMTPDQIALGQLIVLVAIAPVHPAEFVIIRISQKTREAVA